MNEKYLKRMKNVQPPHTPFIFHDPDIPGLIQDKGAGDMHKLPDGASIAAPRIDIAKELAVIAARNKNWVIQCCPVVEIMFNPQLR